VFQRRLKWFVILLSILAVFVVGRLIDVQIVSARQYEGLADRLLTREARYLRAPRGEIQDRTGRTLVSDVPASDISVHFRALAGRSDYLRKIATELKARGRVPNDRPTREVMDELKLRISETWGRLAEITGVPVAELAERAEAVIERVHRIRREQNARSGLVQEVLEETFYHPMIEGVDEETANAVRLEFNEIERPWLAVVPGSRRVTHDADALAHVLGRIGAASAGRIAADPLRGDELRRLFRGDLCGISGVEYAADAALRGVRGYVMEDFGHVEIERADPTPGRPVRLTIDAALQQRVYEILEKAVAAKEVEFPCGASAVVLDAESREVLALVSYPTYSIERYSEEYAKLEADARWMPHRFRAVANQYPPGSTCKVVTLAGALSDEIITPQTRFQCTGHFLPDKPGVFRCWIFNQHLTTHAQSGYPGGLDAVDAIKNSCNIYFFNIGQKLGPERLCDWFLRFGMGKLQGTGLLEESSAIVPTTSYLQGRGRSYEPADPWNFAIGQGEVTATPLQSANVVAAVATGRCRPVRLFVGDGPGLPRNDDNSPPLDERALSVVRAGLYAVVNESGGTAYRYARMNKSGHVLCGKTGSAQASPRVLTWRYTFEWPDGTKESFEAATETGARDQLYVAHPELRTSPLTSATQPVVQTAAKRPRLIGRNAAQRYPPMGPDDKLPSHAWFIGFTQSADTPRGAPPRGRVYAIAVVIEYGGSGGHIGAPAAREIAEAVLERAPQWDGPAVGWAW
jgi:penicillin-binding protein 2